MIYSFLKIKISQFYKCLRDIYKIIFKYIHILQVENLVVVPNHDA